MAKKNTQKSNQPEKMKLVLVRMPRKHKGKIPAAVIRAAVRKVVGERKRREAEAAGSR